MEEVHYACTEVPKGLTDVIVDQSSISMIDGDNGRLYYRGYSIEELVKNSNFEEVSYLVLYGRLPTSTELKEYSQTLINERDIPDNIITILKSFPRNTTRIELLRTAVSALSLYDPDDLDNSEKANFRKGIRVIAKIPTILAYSHRILNNVKIIEPAPEITSHAGNYFYMMTGRKPSPEVTDTFDKVLICHAEHALNASTFAARVTVSSLSDIYSGVVSAIGTLKGPLHGGANEQVIRTMLSEIKKKDQVIPWVESKFAKKEKIMGYGHRVYKVWDPRAKIIRDVMRNYWEKYGRNTKSEDIPEEEIDISIHQQHDKDVDSVFEMTNILTDYMIKKKNLYPNVDLYSAGLLHALGLPTALFTPLFAAARSVGWVAHCIEQLKDNKLIRPLLRYTGELDKKYMPISKR